MVSSVSSTLVTVFLLPHGVFPDGGWHSVLTGHMHLAGWGGWQGEEAPRIALIERLHGDRWRTMKLNLFLFNIDFVKVNQSQLYCQFQNVSLTYRGIEIVFISYSQYNKNKRIQLGQIRSNIYNK